MRLAGGLHIFDEVRVLTGRKLVLQQNLGGACDNTYRYAIRFVEGADTRFGNRHIREITARGILHANANKASNFCD